MDNPRLLLVIALLAVLWLIWLAWEQDYGARPAPEGAAAPEAPAAVTPQDVPEVPAAQAPTGAKPAEAEPGPSRERALETATRIRVRTDVLDVEIDTVGGDLRRVELPRYPVSIEEPETPIRLMNDGGAGLFVAQSGLLAEAGPNHHAVYEAERTEYRLGGGQDALEVRLRWRGAGLEVLKVYTFRRGEYLIGVRHEIRNTRNDRPWEGRLYSQLQRAARAQDGDFLTGSRAYFGGAIYETEDGGMDKIDYEEIESETLSRDIRGGWAAMVQHYFVGAWVPPQDERHHYYSKALPDKRYVLGLVSPARRAAPGDTATFSQQLYVGPKAQSRLAAIAPGLELTVDYGFLTILSKPLFIGLKWIHKVVGNWGWSIVILTILIKLAFYKLSETSYRSMAQMRKVQPRMQAIKEKYGDDRQRMNQALMDLYKKEKINPLGGCLPILVQIPVFIALYWVLLGSVELRQAPFMLWIEDLSTRDPYYVLPVLMGISMVIQQRLNPSPLDPIQQKIMMVLPIVFTVFFAFFPAGLVLYWLVNNVLSIAQQWVIVRRIERAPSSA